MNQDNKRITIMKADITTLTVDVIVNAANTSLLGGGGVDGAIHRAAGPDLLAECRTLHGAKTGEVKSTKGYRLPVKRIYHTPGPIWRGGCFGEADQLKACWTNALNLAREQEMHSIAFPSISTGVYGYPLAEAATIAMSAVKEFINRNSDYDLVIIIVAFDDKTKEAYENARDVTA